MVKNKKENSLTKILAKNIFGIIIFFAVIFLLSNYVQGDKKEEQNITLSELVNDINAEKITTIKNINDKIEITYKDDTVKLSKKENDSSLTETLSNLGVDKSKLALASIEIKDDTSFGYIVMNLLPFLFPVILFFLVIWFLTRGMKGVGGGQAFSFGSSRAKLMAPDGQKEKITFADVAGANEAKHELEEVVDFLKNPKKFSSIGARIPRGILLMGAPGTGKTLLARAVAGEANVSFFSISGSEFVELFVGVGASRVRDMFKVARASQPAIIFIDEIDAVGRVRGVGMGGGNDEREQTLNQILVEMDGFEPSDSVIIMAATNRPDVLDPALLRPGRFDRRVNVELPDRKDRIEILKIHAKNKPFVKDIRLETVAERTPGFSGADLHSVMNEAAILAARHNRKEITQDDLVVSIEKVMLGPIRQTHVMSKKEKNLTAYHEAGHALVASILPYADPVHKVSVISRGRAMGYTLKLPNEDKRMQSKLEFLDDIAVSLGGYVVEKTIFGDLTTGSSNDLQVASALARDMVTKYGMSDAVGPIALEPAGGRTMFGNGVEAKNYSEKTNEFIDNEVSKIMKEAYERVLDIITKNREALDGISLALVEKETLEQGEYEEIIRGFGIKVEKE
ncbi:ATP-dependent zinc metalloprotease FtsH [Candidatus Parcubacteria bacterium]|nr:ATP-dependent zinc metalloprotease FtsH [Candidatus Parcubacteria bacterium]